MAFRHGRNAAISVNGVDLSTFCTNLDLTIDGDTADTTTFGSTWKSSIAGTVGAKLEISGDYDGTNTTGTSAASSFSSRMARPPNTARSRSSGCPNRRRYTSLHW